MKPAKILLVYATWCPHCDPLSVEQAKKMSEDLGVPLQLLDIDKPDDAKIGDSLVKKYGDEAEDYLIPQVFLEFPDGGVQHVFTGFSENTEVTKRHWADFFASEYYRRLKADQSTLIEKYLVSGAKCSRHCDQPATFTKISETDSSIAGAFVCPKNYVSRILYFGDDQHWFEKFLVDHIGKDVIKSRDLRKATRHGWELGGNAEKEIGGITEYYWTPYPATDEEKKYGVFLCPRDRGGCGRLYSKLKADGSELCPECSN